MSYPWCSPKLTKVFCFSLFQKERGFCSKGKKQKTFINLSARLAFSGEGSHVFGDDAQHYLIGAAAYATQAAVSVATADWGFVHEAHAAPVLQARIGNFAL
jgi:hypothetical protein